MKSEMKKGIKMISGIPDPGPTGHPCKTASNLKPYKKTYEKVKKRKEKKWPKPVYPALPYTQAVTRKKVVM